MNLLGTADPGAVTGDALTGLVTTILRILAFGGMGIVMAGIVMTCLCDILECRKLRRAQGRPEDRLPAH